MTELVQTVQPVISPENKAIPMLILSHLTALRIFLPYELDKHLLNESQNLSHLLFFFILLAVFLLLSCSKATYVKTAVVWLLV